MRDYMLEKDWECHGLRCAAILIVGSHRCGYVRVGRDHPLYGKDYEAPDVSVHGGLTYSNTSRKDYPAPDENGDGWWFGFDCAHSGDGLLYSGYRGSDPVRDTQYVTAECESLAKQLSEIKHDPT